MRCEDCLNQLNAQVDGELSVVEGAELDAHLAECSQCRDAAEALRTVDLELERAFAPRRQAAALLVERTAALVPYATDKKPPLPPPLRGLAWDQILPAAAAGFLLALAMLRPWQSAPTATHTLSGVEPVARLAVASGPVEVQPPRKIAMFNVPPAAPIERSSVVRTGPTTRCEIALQDGNAVRLDCNTQIKLEKSRVVEVNQGRIWSRSQAGGKGLEIRARDGKIVPKTAAEVAFECQPQAVRLIVISGSVDVQTREKSVEVPSGKQVRIANGTIEDDPHQRDVLLETAWVNSLLALRGPSQGELVDRVSQLLAKVGEAKHSLLYEDELRRLGDAGVPPLLAYLESTKDSPDGSRRATAARIVADVAQPRWIADLIALLTDPNADVRFQAARGLERLTGRNQGIAPTAWQSQPWAECESAHEKWRQWWAANRDSYAANTRDIPEPAAPPF